MDKADVDFPLLVAPTTNKWWLNNVLGLSDTSSSFILRYVANGDNLFSNKPLTSMEFKYICITFLLAKKTLSVIPTVRNSGKTNFLSQYDISPIMSILISGNTVSVFPWLMESWRFSDDGTFVWKTSPRKTPLTDSITTK